jgi:hypothetical protein
MEQDANATLRMTPSPDAYIPQSGYAAYANPETPVNAGYKGRAALTADSTRLASFAKGSFLTSAIPVAGQPFFDSGSRANLQANGSAVGIKTSAETWNGVGVSGYLQVLAQNTSVVGDANGGGGNVALQQAFGQLGRLCVGIMETAFADPTSIPEVLDLAGPNARITVQPAGAGDGQGRLSYFLFSDANKPGFIGNLSIEQPAPEIQTTAATSKFSRCPDFITTWKYTQGIEDKKYREYIEDWHIQFGTVFRSLGLENDSGTFEQAVFGWGTSLSGMYRIPSYRGLAVRDGVFFSATYGEGIGHYIVDLRSVQTDNTGNDAIVDANGDLVALPVLAWYVGYTHNWVDFLRSSVTFSQVDLDSVVPLAVGPAPYRRGNYVAVNLVYHELFEAFNSPSYAGFKNFYTGIEYLYGHKEILDGADGEAHRFLWLVSLSN